MEMIRFDGVQKSYGDKLVIPDFSLAVERGEFVTMVGGSGSGKTTLLKMVNGLVLPEAGTVFVEGRDIRGEDLIALRRNIGYAIQGNSLFPHMTVEKNIAYVPHLLNGEDRAKTRHAVEKWAAALDLEPELLGRYPAELSGGQAQRVGLARALAASPYILLMDEPFGAVDGITRKGLQKEIARIHKEHDVTILFVTHDMGEALRLGTKVLVLEQGRLAQYGTPQEIVDSPASAYVAALVGE